MDAGVGASGCVTHTLLVSPLLSSSVSVSPSWTLFSSLFCPLLLLPELDSRTGVPLVHTQIK